ncbi:ammonia channel protein [Oleiphilus sp. HI0071]|uniref:ammonium transporter n=1 Tax=unclassified Oleiphilus TaxID=2631174 RepID=UPI0007C33324|nr:MULTISPECIES: ammonium transporter [unclassified Oleiphilus]KZY73434.1 ammonia channel protein [Oleiphilus sp. HI0065]KZY80248.1 ammonia channel protein [Oleiphilus sp. HI0071]KZY93392.1 ammonia channel protein [Oleiphilus sp. HI0073]KZZ58927.1 ammonia channel protein [Oleiphilus sp. HI0122]KZZ72720.1 ammonia channel protein [Oleiphilus sp. HI0130]KZZ81532.1 ammonia channel protein [Oleiphilus sp. HI0133]
MLKLLTLVTLLMPGFAYAEGGISGADTAWILTATALVLFMTIPGLSLFYAGLVRNKNVLSVLMQCFALTCLMSVLWYVIGYSLAFSEGSPFVGGIDNLFMAQVTKDSLAGTIPEGLFAAFQMTFAVITPALIVGAFAERMKFSSMLLFSSIWLLAVYAPVCHWVWGGGWLSELGVLDFAGGIVVHITAGVAALVAALVIGNRKNWPQTAMPPHNMTMTVTGAGMLWVGWFGFNAGSALAADENAAMALIATHLSAAMGSLAWMACEWRKFGKPSVLGIVTGMVAGLGTITPASGSVSPAAAIVIGLSAGVVCFYATMFIKQKLKIDDSLDVFPVHGVGGILGSFLVGIFAATELGAFSGYGFGGDNNTIGEQLTAQLIGIGSTIAYTAIVTWIILKLVDVITGLRADEEDEYIGLDIAMHEEKGYDL